MADRSTSAEELVEYYDPTDVFGDLADALAEAFPSIAPEIAAFEAGDAADGEAEPTTARRTRDDDADGDEAPTARPRPSRPTRRAAEGDADRVTMRLVRAELVDSREILPGQWLQSFHAPELATGARAGQFVHVRTGDLSGLVLRRPFSINTADPATGDRSRSTSGRSAAARNGSPSSGPATRSTCSGRSGGRSRSTRAAAHLLLIAGGLGMAGVRTLADEAIRDGRQVDAPVRGGVGARGLPVVAAARRGRVRHRDRRRLGRPHGFVTELVADYEALGRPGVRLRAGADARRAGAARGRAARAARRREARPEARRRQGRPGRLAGRPSQGVPPGVDGAEHGLRGRGVPRLRGHGHERARRSGSAARGRCSRAEEVAWEARRVTIA